MPLLEMTMFRWNAGARAPLAVAGFTASLLAFAVRFLSFRGPANDHYMHLAWAQQMLLGEIPGRDFIEPGMPLAVAISALVQMVWRGPLSEGILSIAMLAAAAGITTVVVAVVSRSVVAGFAAALLQTAFYPRLYSYPKILVPAVALLLLLVYARRPSRKGLIALAAWTVLAFLFRHDLGLVAGVATAIAVLATHADDWRGAARAAGTFVVLGLVLVTPYLLLLEATEGIGQHIRTGLEFSKGETHQLLGFDLPALRLSSGTLATWSAADAGVLLFWTIHAILLIGTVLLVIRWRLLGTAASVIAAAMAFLFLYRLYVLRHALPMRAPDLAAVIAIPALWTSVELLRLAFGRRVARPVQATALGSVAVLVLTAVTAGVVTLRDLGEDIRRTNVSRGVRGAVARATQVVLDNRTPLWPMYWPAGEVPEAVGYLAACTAPTDRIFITWPAPEYYFFAGRGFADGHAWPLSPRAFVADQDQDLMLHRLQSQSVPIALVNESRYDEFAMGLPRVANYLERTYQIVGDYEIRDGSRITIRVKQGLTTTSRYKDLAWPCGI